MSENSSDQLDSYYDYVKSVGLLRTEKHAKLWSNGVLEMLGTAVNRKTKSELGDALPKELKDSLYGIFWLLHFRDPNQTREEFCERVARRSGNSNAEFAFYPTMAVFGGIKSLINVDLSDQVAQSLSPEVREMWQRAEPIPEAN